MSKKLYDALMESMKNRENPVNNPIINKSPKELAKEMIQSFKEFKDDSLSDEEIQDIEAAAGYFE